MTLAEKHIKQWNKLESLEVNPHIHSQLIFDKSAKNMQWRKDSLFNKQWGEKLGI
jgi:hypothetical protein